MKNYMFEKLKPHIGHNIVCVQYSDNIGIADICIECTDCNEVLISAETCYKDIRDHQERCSFIGKEAWIDGRRYKCIRVEDDAFVFDASPCGEIKINYEEKITWRKYYGVCEE